jgi:hypothetical protein
MSKRKGMSMAEVLVALFLLALGTIAILTMFPLGMYHMGQALKDDRTAQAAQQADASMRMYWRMNVVEPGVSTTEPLSAAMSNPDSGLAAAFQRGTATVTSGPSYPVCVDPMGVWAPWGTLNTPAHQYWMGGAVATPPLPPFIGRRSVNMLTSLPAGASQRFCSLMDGYGFAENGTPSQSTGSVDRELRYNWMWILQRPDVTVPNTASMTVVVFDKRAFQFAQQNAEQVFSSEYPNQAPFFTAPGNANNTIVMQPLLTTIQVPVARGVPTVQKGGWLLDATYLPAGNAFAPAGMRHAIFYRVVSVTDNTATTGFTDIEVQSPIRRLDGTTNSYPGTLIHLTGVSEVFERSNLTAQDW